MTTPDAPMRIWSSSRLVILFAALAVGTASGLSPLTAAGQVTPTDSAAVVLETARLFEAEGRWEVAEPLYRLIVERWGVTPAAAEARARLDAPPAQVVYGDGRVELTVWMTLYGAWLGVALPGAFGADSPEPYGAGLLIGAPTGFLVGRGLARRLDLTEGQARAITLGGSWGTWQGFGWQEAFDWGVDQQCDRDPSGGEFCYDLEDSYEEAFAGAVVGGLTGVLAGALLSGADITPGTGTMINNGALWGSWFGFAGGVLANLDDDDDVLAATLIGGNAGLLATALLAPGWNLTRSRARLISIAGVLGALAGGGVDLLIQPDDERVAVAIPLVASVAGLAIGALATRDGSPGAVEAAADGALLRLEDGRLGLAMPTPMPTVVRSEGPRGPRWHPAIGVELFRASF